MTKVTIRTFYNLVLLHIRLKGVKNELQTLMVELTAKLLEFQVLSLVFAG